MVRQDSWPPATVATNGQLQKIAQSAKTAVSGISHDDMIENFDLEKLPRSNEVPGDPDVGFGWCRFAARMIVRDNDGGGACHDG